MGLANYQVHAGATVVVFVPLYRSVRDSAPDLAPIGRPIGVDLGYRRENLASFARSTRAAARKSCSSMRPSTSAAPACTANRGTTTRTTRVGSPCFPGRCSTPFRG